MKAMTWAVFILLLAWTAVFIIELYQQEQSQSGYLLSPDELQQMINERLPEGYRIRQDGRLGTETTDALIYLLTPPEDRDTSKWDKFLETIRIPTCTAAKEVE